ncbi:MAG: hypothetical protein FWF02_08775 [Micrococcales bacterium]|nr:hypothetical protein [Micrococcales bacterium]MCL2667782.1 hypothetical protein [Micrococcales bacterium]
MNLLDREKSLLANPSWTRGHSWWVVGIVVAFILPLLAPVGFVYPAMKSTRKMWWVVLAVLGTLTVSYYVVAAANGHATLGLFTRMYADAGAWIVGPYVMWAITLVTAIIMRPMLLRELARTAAEASGRLTAPAVGIEQFPVHDAPTWPGDRR